MELKFAALLEDGKFSDVTLRCEGEEFRVHKCIICMYSPVFAAACDGNFKEAIDDYVDVNVINKCTLQRMLKFFYTNDYSEPLGHTERDSYGCGIRHTRNVSGSSSFNEEFTETPNTSSKLMAHAQVYIAADYYQVPELMDHAIRKFETATSNTRLSGLQKVIPLVYGLKSESVEKLRSSVCTVILEHPFLLLNDKEFVDLVVDLPKFMKDFLLGFGRKYTLSTS